MALKNSAAGYDSAFEEDFKLRKKQQEHHANIYRERGARQGLPSRILLVEAASQEEGRRLRYQMSNMTAYERHKMLINHYVLYHPGSTAFLKRDTSKDKKDMDVIRENHQFLWESSDPPDTWERDLAKKYYDKLFKEYCICDLSRYKENKVGMRWRIETEVIGGEGQFTCGEKRCLEQEGLRTWEMNFSYLEQGVKKNALVKLRLCHNCSYKVNYHHKRREVTKLRKRKHREDPEKRQKKRKEEEAAEGTEEAQEGSSGSGEAEAETKASLDDIWKGPAKLTDEKTRDDEFEEYLEDLFL